MLIYVFNAHQGVLNRPLANEKYLPLLPYSAKKLSSYQLNKISRIIISMFVYYLMTNGLSFVPPEPVADSRSAFPCSGGESHALARLKHYFWDTVSTCFFAHLWRWLIENVLC